MAGMQMVYDFASFIKMIEDLSLKEMIDIARRTAHRADEASRRRRGAPEARAAGSGLYVAQLGDLVYFLQHRKLPDRLADEMRDHLRDIAERLAARGDLPADVMTLFS